MPGGRYRAERGASSSWQAPDSMERPKGWGPMQMVFLHKEATRVEVSKELQRVISMGFAGGFRF